MNTNPRALSLEDIINREDAKVKRLRVTISISKDAYDTLKKTCGPVPFSRAIERMIHFLSSGPVEKKSYDSI